jgi:hypothetical protein
MLGFVLVLAAWAQNEEITLKIPPVEYSVDMGGEPVRFAVFGVVSGVSAGPFRLALTVELGDLQQNLTALLRAQLNRSDRCGERLSVERASMAPDAPAAVLTANVHYERWACAKVFGKEAVKKLVGGDGIVEVKLTPSAGADGVSLASDVERMEADGSLGELLRTGSLGASVRDKIASSIQSAIRKALHPSDVPPSILEAAAIQTAKFSDGGGGRLRFFLGGEARLSADQFQLLAKQLK